MKISKNLIAEVKNDFVPLSRDAEGQLKGGFGSLVIASSDVEAANNCLCSDNNCSCLEGHQQPSMKNNCSCADGTGIFKPGPTYNNCVCYSGKKPNNCDCNINTQSNNASNALSISFFRLITPRIGERIVASPILL